LAAVRFTQRIALRGINPYLRLSAELAQELKPGWRKPLPVRVTINGRPRSAARVNLMPVGDGGFYLYLNGPLREASGTAVGDRVTARVAFDASYRGGPSHAAPPSLVRGLRARPDAAQAWVALPPSRRKEILRYLAGLRTEAARERNVAKLLTVLTQPRREFLGRPLGRGETTRSSNKARKSSRAVPSSLSTIERSSALRASKR